MDDDLEDLETSEVEDATHCPGDKHYYVSSEVSTAKFIRGNARCKVVTKFMLYCVECGTAIFVTDPDQPEII